jgi:predicted dehydrogenase
MVTLGVVGLGYWGPNLVRNFARAKGVRLKYCCDLDEARLKRVVASYPDVIACSDYGQVLADPEVDAVVVATSVPTHHKLALSALAAGKHVFVEKPLATTVAEAEELVATAEKAGLILMVGHLLEYHPAVTRIKKVIDSGELGDLLYIYSQRLNLGKVRAEENALWSLAPHDISIMLYFMGAEPDEAVARGGAFLRDGVEDVVFCTLHFPDGRLGHLHVSWLDPHKIRKFTLVGSKKMLVFDDQEASDKIWIYDKGVEPSEAMAYGDDLTLRFGDITIPNLTLSEPLAIECAEFVGAIESGRPPRSDGQDGLRVVRVLEAASKSLAAGGKPVRL